MSSKIAIACGALGILIGVGATVVIARPGDGPRDQPAQARLDARDHRGAPIVVERGGVQAGELRTLVAEEVRAALRDQAATAPSSPATSKDAASEPSPAFAQTQGRVADRVAHGTWSVADRDWLRSTLGDVNDTERKALMQQVIVAANTGALRVELEGPLF